MRLTAAAASTSSGQRSCPAQHLSWLNPWCCGAGPDLFAGPVPECRPLQAWVKPVSMAQTPCQAWQCCSNVMSFTPYMRIILVACVVVLLCACKHAWGESV